jgi:site-specific recombinase XerD
MDILQPQLDDIITASQQRRALALPLADGGPRSTTQDLIVEWARVTVLWLDGRRPNSQRAYFQAWAEFFGRGIDCAGIGDRMERIREILTATNPADKRTWLKPWTVSSSDAEQWKFELRNTPIAAGKAHAGAALSDATVGLKLAALSSFFQFACKYPIRMAGGSEHPLIAFNPFVVVERPEVDPFDKARWLTPDQVKAFLGVIPTLTFNGLRDWALMLFYTTTGRRNSEVRLIQARHFERQDDGRVFIRLEAELCKGKHGQVYELPGEVWTAMTEYLAAVGRPFESLQPNDYIFTALSDSSERFHGKAGRALAVGGAYRSNGSPLSAKEVGRLVKKYAVKAKLGVVKIEFVGKDGKRHTRTTSTVKPHMLRHSYGRGMIDAGAPLATISKALGHASLDMTGRYTNKLKEREQTEYDGRVIGLFGVSELAKRRQRRLGT